MIRFTLPALSAVFALAIAAPAVAKDDPLLSGYGGPGGGDQVILGSTLLPGGKSGGSLRAASKTPQRGATSGSAAPAASGSPTRSGTPRSGTAQTGSASGTTSNGSAAAGGGGGSTRGASGSGANGGSGSSSSGTSGSATGSGASTDVARSVEAVPAANVGAGSASLPIGGGEILLALLAIAGIGGIAVATSRLARRPLSS